jgi:GcrA cell cycle regulator
MEWSCETITRLRKLWYEGLPTAEIGRLLGVSKNAVVGKAHRLDLPARPSPIRRDDTADDPYGKQRDGTANRMARRHLLVHGTLPPLPTIVPTAPAPRPEPVTACQAKDASQQATDRRPRGADRRVGRAGAAQPPHQKPAATPPPESAPLKPVYVRPLPSCCWPLGELRTKSFRFCGDACVDYGKPYCADHARLARAKRRSEHDDDADRLVA